MMCHRGAGGRSIALKQGDQVRMCGGVTFLLDLEECEDFDI